MWLKNKIRQQAVNDSKRELILRSTQIEMILPTELAYLINLAKKKISFNRSDTEDYWP